MASGNFKKHPMKFLYIFLACYVISFVAAWLLAAKRLARMARVLKEQGLPDSKIDELYQTMSQPTWIMSVRFTLVTGTLLGTVGSIVCAIAF